MAVDTNTLVSAILFPGSVPRKVLNAVRTRGQLVGSLETLQELGRVLLREKFDRHLALDQRIAAVRAIYDASEIVTIRHHVTACRDPKDDMFLSLLVAGTADLLVTGDQDLLVLDPFRGIRILTASASLAFFSEA